MQVLLIINRIMMVIGYATFFVSLATIGLILIEMRHTDDRDR